MGLRSAARSRKPNHWSTVQLQGWSENVYMMYPYRSSPVAHVWHTPAARTAAKRHPDSVYIVLNDTERSVVQLFTYRAAQLDL